MIENKDAETQFSIYKIDIDKVHNHFKIKYHSDGKDKFEQTMTILIKDIKKQMESKYKFKYENIEYNDFIGLIFKTMHIPAWKGIAKELLNIDKENNDKRYDDFLTNANISYVLFYYFNDNIYAFTGGYGSHYIKNINQR